ncbi:MAG: recombinase family protein [Flavobacteriales bacterium]|nr:recombinase family protein [Flavobacteriales bacterium]
MEFQKMLKFARQKKAVTHIIVYSYDRFSRTGANGAYISDQLKKQGIATLSATQEVDVDTAAGSFQQNLYYMFSQFDNELRRDKTITGMKEKLRKGYWFGHVPLGYINLNPGRGKEQNIVSNEDGKLIGLAFKWKAREGLTYSEISKKLKKMGLIIRDKRLSDIFRNPFYCGLITHKLISGEVIVGKHEGVVSKELFLKVNKLLTTNQNGYSRDEENLPLKQFVKSADCGTPYTGYIVRKKNLYYYKNNRIGSKENRNAKVMHNKFVDLLKIMSLQIKSISLQLLMECCSLLSQYSKIKLNNPKSKKKS